MKGASSPPRALPGGLPAVGGVGWGLRPSPRLLCHLPSPHLSQPSTARGPFFPGKVLACSHPSRPCSRGYHMTGSTACLPSCLDHSGTSMNPSEVPGNPGHLGIRMNGSGRQPVERQGKWDRLPACTRGGPLGARRHLGLPPMIVPAVSDAGHVGGASPEGVNQPQSGSS